MASIGRQCISLRLSFAGNYPLLDVTPPHQPPTTNDFLFSRFYFLLFFPFSYILPLYIPLGVSVFSTTTQSTHPDLWTNNYSPLRFLNISLLILEVLFSGTYLNIFFIARFKFQVQVRKQELSYDNWANGKRNRSQR